MKTDLSNEKWILLHKIPKEDILEYILKWEFEWFREKILKEVYTYRGDPKKRFLSLDDESETTSISAAYPEGKSGDYFLFVDKAREGEDKNSI